MALLDRPAHVQQLTLGYCLPACGQMALAQLGIETTQEQVAQVLETRMGVGTPFSRVKRLQKWVNDVRITEWGGAKALGAALDSNVAVIVALTTTPALPGWGDIRTQHTVLVVNVGLDRITYYDPALSQGPVSASRNEFLLSWSEMAELTAFLK